MMADDLSITVTNESLSRSWTRKWWDCGAGESPKTNWTDQVTQTPLDTLQAMNGQARAAADTEHLGSLLQDDLYMLLGYVSDNGETFAVQIQRRFHMIGIGRGDQWRTSDDGVTWTPWTENTETKTWQFADCKVVATPTLSNEAASVDIVISDT